MLEIEAEQDEAAGAEGKGESRAIKVPDVVIPPIPEPPSPPQIKDMNGLDLETFEDQHPYYLPKGKEHFVAHLDKNCFHIVDGRYFGLLTNNIADPHFVGPSAPGISGLNISGGTGLATAHSGSSSGTVLTASALAPAPAGASPVLNKGTVNSIKSGPKKPVMPPTDKEATGNGSKPANTVPKKKSAGIAPTASSSELRKIIEEGGEEAERMKTCIIRAAVHASRSGKHGQSFRAPNGEVYADVSKAFAAHAGLKPCMRCKNNKQGVSVLSFLVFANTIHD